MDGGKSSIEVGLAVGVIATVFGLIYGAVSGFFGGAVDAVMMRIVDVGLAVPVVFLFIFMAQVYKPTLTLLIVLLAHRLVVDSGPPGARRDARACEPASTCRRSR